MLNKTVLLLVFLLIGTTSNAQEKYLENASSILLKKRSAIVVDISGEKTELSALKFEPDGRYHFRFTFPNYGSSFVIVKKPVELRIPINMILSIQYNGDTCMVEYKFMGEKQTASGKYLTGKFVGSFDFGDFTLEAGKVKSIIFTEPPIEVKLPKLNATVLLKDGLNIPSRDLEIIDLFSAPGHSIYINWAPMNTFVMSDSAVEFKKGVSSVSVPFEKIKTINFLPDNKSISIILRSGKKINGIFSKYDEKQKGTIEGISGVSDKGGFFINLEYIKAVEFNTKQ